MTGERPGTRLFRAWKESAPPPFDTDAGRARFLSAAFAMRSRPRSGAKLAIGAAAVLAAAIATTAVIVRREPASAPLASVSREPPVEMWLESDANELPLSFSEGSRVVMMPSSRGRAESLTSDGGSFLLEHGAFRAHVVHRARTDWRFLAGPFEVRVTGTTLEVAWDPSSARFSVSVDEGEVTVSGPAIASAGIVRAGERCDVDVRSATVRLSSSRADLPPSATLAPSTAPIRGALRSPSAGPRDSRSSEPWTTFEERGDYAGAFAAASRAGLASLYRASSADELLRLAQVAQLSGHRDVEREALLACRRRFPGTEQAAVAAYDLGRESSASDAVSWFETYLREQPTGPLVREAMGRLIEANASARDDAAAKAAAKRYLERFPNGPHAPIARRIAEGAQQ